MRGPRPRLLLILPSHIYQADAFVAAASALDVDLTVASEFPSSLERHQPDKLMTLDLKNPAAAVSQAEEFNREYPLSVVFGVTDETVVTAAAISQALDLPHIPAGAAALAHNKHRQREVLRASGVAVPRYDWRHIDRDADGECAVPFPVVIKPVCLSGSRGVIRADDPDEFAFAQRRTSRIIRAHAPDPSGDGGSYLVESYVPGPEFALEGLVVDGRLHVLALFDKPDPLDGPFFPETIYVTPSRHPELVQSALVRCAEEAVAAVGIDRGPVHIELRHNERGAWLIELAARPIGGKCGRVLEFEQGRSLEQVLLGHATGLQDQIPIRVPGATGVMMIPALEAGTLQEISGVDAARRIGYVTDLVVSAHVGQELEPLPEGAQYLGFIFARAPTPEVVETALREAYKELTFTNA